MRRILSIWLPSFPLERLERDEPGAVPSQAPFALVAAEGSRLTVSAATPPALAAGIKLGQGLADARAIVPALISRPAEPARDAVALARLSRWSVRYGPAFNTDADDGLWVDVTGVAHLYGGEPGLMADLGQRLARLGFTARVGLADGLGAASALARYSLLAPDDSFFGEPPASGGRLSRNESGSTQIVYAAQGGRLPGGESPGASKKPPAAADSYALVIAPPGKTARALVELPVEALRLAAAATRLLRRLGLKRIGQLYALPRPALERRFRSKAEAGAVLLRLDQALGLKAEPLRPMRVPPKHAVQAIFSEPLISGEGLEAALTSLAADLCAGLEAAHRGARRLTLALHRSDGARAVIRAGLSRPGRSAPHMLKLLAAKFNAIDAGFGIDLMQLAATVTEPLVPAQAGLAGGADTGYTNGEALAALIDRLAGRLGAARVLTLEPRASHLPERAEVFVPALTANDTATNDQSFPVATAARPPLLLPVPEPVTVVAELPEGPPELIRWRGILHHIARAEGPERIAPEWWREIGAAASQERDYYLVESEAGARLWLFRDGRHGETEEAGRAPAWYVHGVFG